MTGLNPAVAEELERLRCESGSDFAAIATALPTEAVWRWTYAAGNLNGRYAFLSIRPSRGVAGAVLRTERVIVLDQHRHAVDLRKEDGALFTAERLEAAAAAPVRLQADSPLGVLLIGSRTSRDYDEAAVKLLSEAAVRLSAIFTNSADQSSVS